MPNKRTATVSVEITSPHGPVRVIVCRTKKIYDEINTACAHIGNQRALNSAGMVTRVLGPIHTVILPVTASSGVLAHEAVHIGEWLRVTPGGEVGEGELADFVGRFTHTCEDILKTARKAWGVKRRKK